MNTVRHILQIKASKYVWSIAPEQTVYDALRLMSDKDVGALLVMEGDKTVGIISERDYARKVILFNKSSRETLVNEIMTSKLVTVHPDQTANECMELMINKRIRHLPVMENDQLVGMISIGDVLKDIMYEQRKIIQELEDKLTTSGQ
jgi:CBS domain-containing protein